MAGTTVVVRTTAVAAFKVGADQAVLPGVGNNVVIIGSPPGQLQMRIIRRRPELCVSARVFRRRVAERAAGREFDSA